MKTLTSILAVLFICAPAWADGMIVPVREDIRVRGSWAVRYHHVDIQVRDQVAAVSIDQEFINTSAGMIEVEYVFPVPPEAAIDSMTLMVNGQEFAAKLLKSDEARRIYEDIVRRKKDPALLEYVGFGMLKTSAFPLEPGKPARVLITYKTPCRKDRDLVQVWYPLNTEKFSSRPLDEVRVTVDIKSAADITAVYSPTHDLKVERKDPRQVIATYQEKGALPTADFLVYYKAADEQVGATVLACDGTFMLLVSPNPRSAAASVAAKDVVLVLDHSGSMSGEKIAQVKDAVKFILNNLNAEDRFNVIAYNDAIDPFFDGLKDAGRKNVEEALERADRLDASGGTNIHDSLVAGMKQFPRENGRPAYLIFLTDGLATVGQTDSKAILKDATAANEAGVRLFAFGVGYDVNAHLLDKLVGDNHGRSDYAKPKENIEAKVSSLYAKIKNPVMTALKMEIADVRLRDMYPREMPDLFEGDQIIVLGRYSAEDAAKLGDKPAQLVIRGTFEGKEKAFEYPVSFAPKGLAYSFVEKLWAMRRVGWILDQIQLNGENKELIDELIRLSTEYGIMTPYTSFLADEGRVATARPEELRSSAESSLRVYRKESGDAAQMDAKNRQGYRSADKAPAATGAGGGVAMKGQAEVSDYEESAGEKILSTVRQAGNETLYRGKDNRWATPEAAKVDPAKAKVVTRFSDEYFALAAANTAEENQVLSLQQDGEELMIELRGEVYLIR